MSTPVTASISCPLVLPTVNIGGKRPKTFNLLTYKYHSLADYVATIKLLGTTESFSTQPVCPLPVYHFRC